MGNLLTDGSIWLLPYEYKICRSVQKTKKRAVKQNTPPPLTKRNTNDIAAI